MTMNAHFAEMMAMERHAVLRREAEASRLAAQARRGSIPDPRSAAPRVAAPDHRWLARLVPHLGLRTW
jgi:hypothetical protein